MNSTISALLLASAVGLSAFENLDFEQTPPPMQSWTDDVPGWRHVGAIGAIGGANDYWNVNTVNLSGWAEALVIHLNGPPPSLPAGMGSPLEGLVSIAFSAVWPLLPGQPTTNDYTSAWIAQTGTIAPAVPWLGLVTDYLGPHIAYHPENPADFSVGYLRIYFEGTPVAFTLEDAGTGPMAQPLTQLWADLRPFSGQEGELRIGIEGPHLFTIDSIAFVPEPSALALLLCAGTVFCLCRKPFAVSGTPRRSASLWTAPAE